MDLAQAALQRGSKNREETLAEGTGAPELSRHGEVYQNQDVVAGPVSGLGLNNKLAARPANPAGQVIVPPPGLSALGEATVILLNESRSSNVVTDEVLGRFSREALDTKSSVELVLNVFVARAASQRTIWSTPARQQLVRNLTIALGRTGQSAPQPTRPHSDLLGFPQRDLTSVDVAFRIAMGKAPIAELHTSIKTIESVDGLRSAFEASCRLLDMNKLSRTEFAALFGTLYRCQAKLVAKLGSNATVIPLAAAGPRNGFVIGQPPRQVSFSRTDIECVLSAIQKTTADQIPAAKAVLIALTRSFMFDVKDLMLFGQALEDRQHGRSDVNAKRIPTLMD